MHNLPNNSLENSLIIFTTAFVVIVLSIIFNYPKADYRNRGLKQCLNITCHFQTNPNTLNSTDLLKRIPRDGSSIFFHETSCASEPVSPRSACAVESAARTNPGRNVYLLLSAPIEEVHTQEGLLAVLQQYKNAKIARIEFNEYIKDTPLIKNWTDIEKSIMKPMFMLTQASNVLRMLTMWKFGGIYLDLDFIVVRSLEDLFTRRLRQYSWTTRGTTMTVNDAALRFGFDAAGRTIIHDMLKEMKLNFNTGRAWASDGPFLLTKVLKNYCTTPTVTEMNKATCHGFEVFDFHHFYPISDGHFTGHFLPLISEEFKKIEKPYMFHMVKKFPYNGKDEAAYEYLAEKYCPRVYEASMEQSEHSFR